MLEGILWKVTFKSANDMGFGVISFQNGKVFGGDSSFYYSGTYTVSASQVNASVKIKQHSQFLQSIFSNVTEFTAKITGNVTQTPIAFTGRVDNFPQFVLSGILEKLETI